MFPEMRPNTFKTCLQRASVYTNSLLLSLILVHSGEVSAQNVAAVISEQSNPEYWRNLAQSEVKKTLALGDDGKRAHNLILFIGDGMGVSTITAARIYAGQKNGQPGEEHQLSFEKFPYTAIVKTYNIDQQTPDSAGTMTAIITGVKTRAGVISVDGRAQRGDCESSQGHYLTTLLEEAELSGMATGVVTTTRVTHATLAAAYAHSPERNWESNADMPAQAKTFCRDIARQLVEFSYGDGIDVILGGGRSQFLPTHLPDSEYPNKRGKRTDTRNLITEWIGDDRSASYVWNLDQFEHVSPLRTQRLLGLFEPSHMQFEADRADDPKGEPSLSAMTTKAIKLLERRGRGYILIVEGGRIDHAHHAANAYRALDETLALSDAISVAVESTGDDTLIVVTADHSHTMTIGGYSARGNNILGKVRTLDEQGKLNESLALDGNNLPYTTLNYANGPGWSGESSAQQAGSKQFPHWPRVFANEPVSRPNLDDVDTHDKNYMQEVAVPLRAETHGGEDVVVYATGPGASWFRGVIEQNKIYWLMKEALKVFAKENSKDK